VGCAAEYAEVGLGVTAILIAGELRGRASKSLGHLLSQTALARMEILVADLCPDGGPLAGADHPAVRYRRWPHLAYYSEAQAAAVREARAPVVAFIEDHAYASPGWAQVVLEGFEDRQVAAVNYTSRSAGGGYWSLPGQRRPQESSWRASRRAGCLGPGRSREEFRARGLAIERDG
jgi:hypothetical protein